MKINFLILLSLILTICKVSGQISEPLFYGIKIGVTRQEYAIKANSLISQDGFATIEGLSQKKYIYTVEHYRKNPIFFTVAPVGQIAGRITGLMIILTPKEPTPEYIENTEMLDMDLDKSTQNKGIDLSTYAREKLSAKYGAPYDATLSNIPSPSGTIAIKTFKWRTKTTEINLIKRSLGDNFHRVIILYTLKDTAQPNRF